ncbi:MAG: SMP-30/gluconolactonase/LRE family protein [Gemmatimonadaceae bacterium]|jgi:sugar lactone lactonase YvrE|nr:SMP-30/gluconolactonase/LRE family protein [Gemmatimonadaceae bacterium]
MPTRCLWRARAQLAETPRADPRSGAIAFVDLVTPRLYRFGTGLRHIEPLAGPVALLGYHGDSGLIGASATHLLRWDTGETRPRVVATLPFDPERVRVNDGWVEADGTCWIATMARDGQRPIGELWRVDARGSRARCFGGVPIVNGPAISPDGRRALVADSVNRTIWCLEADRVELWARFDDHDGVPDGMVWHPDGTVWVAHYGGGKVSQWSADGTRKRSVPVPFVYPTALAVAALQPECLYVTSARHPREGTARAWWRGSGALWLLTA